MMDNRDTRETIEMLKMIKEQAIKCHNDTLVFGIKIDSFNFVLDKAINLLLNTESEGNNDNTTKQL